MSLKLKLKFYPKVNGPRIRNGITHSYVEPPSSAVLLYVFVYAPFFLKSLILAEYIALCGIGTWLYLARKTLCEC